METLQKEEVCCLKFDPAPWDNKTFTWNNKKFIKDKVFTLFYMPVNFGGVMKRCQEKIEKTGTVGADAMWLSDHTSKWNMDLYISVDTKVEDAENVVMSGNFFSKVYEGNFKDTGKWMEDFERFTTEKGMAVKKMFMWYTTCPKCAKKYGKNYVVIIGQLL